MGEHLIDGEFQSDKYPTCPRGKVPLSCKDVTAQDLLWLYAKRRRAKDAEFSNDLEEALRLQGFEPPESLLQVFMLPPLPVDMILFCPMCGLQHVDAADPAKGWHNPPHKSHLCHLCGHVWRPADIETNGVNNIKTKGSRDSARVTRACSEPPSNDWAVKLAGDLLEKFHGSVVEAKFEDKPSWARRMFSVRVYDNISDEIFNEIYSMTLNRMPLGIDWHVYRWTDESSSQRSISGNHVALTDTPPNPACKVSDAS